MQTATQIETTLTREEEAFILLDLVSYYNAQLTDNLEHYDPVEDDIVKQLEHVIDEYNALINS